MRTAAFLVIFLAGCSRSVVTPFPTKGAAPSTAEEVVVAKWILDHADDPGSVEFAKWGPNAKPGEYKHPVHSDEGGFIPKMTLGTSPNHIVRVVYREKNRAGALVRRDRIIHLHESGKTAAESPDNPNGDGWLTFWTDKQKR